MKTRKLLLSAAMLFMVSAPAFADAKTEAYVEINANSVLASLNAPGKTADERREEFQVVMDEFANIDAVARFTIGKYARRFTDEEMQRFTTSFRAYALAVYEFYFNAFKGKEVDVTGSIDRNANDSIVDTTIIREDGEPMNVRWRVLNRRGEYQVVDVALRRDGNLIWLAIEQQAQFLSILDKSNGSVDALIAKIDSMTADVIARRGSESL